MPRIPDARPVFEIADPPLRPAHAASYQFRLLVARNLAEVVGLAHTLRHVVGDGNGGNFLVNTSGRVTLIDVDSLQVNAGGSVHRCLVGTPEYTPPELQGVDLSSVDRTPHHDAFGLAVLTFELLAGHHPFLGRSTEPGRAPNLAEAIQRGLWPHATGGRAEYLPSPLAPRFDIHPAPLRRLWQRCFADGHHRPDARPSAAEWVQAIDAELGHPPAAATPARTPRAVDETRDPFSNPVAAGVAISVALLVSGFAIFDHFRERGNTRPPTAPPAVAPHPGLRTPAVHRSLHDPEPPAPDPPAKKRDGLPNPAVWEALR